MLLPSLALIGQTLDEWMQQTKWEKLAFLCVCSDKSVQGEDALQMRPADMDFPVSTDSTTVSRFLRQPFRGVKVIFSTYQSSRVVAELLGADPGDDAALGMLVNIFHDQRYLQAMFESCIETAYLMYE